MPIYGSTIAKRDSNSSNKVKQFHQLRTIAGDLDLARPDRSGKGPLALHDDRQRRPLKAL
jgi:hypothetical protein